jgi:diadenosine tetraphosphate (Ap4A) HIT family hydrolase
MDPDMSLPSAAAGARAPRLGCVICAQENEDDRIRVFADDRWAAEVFAGYEVPGWLVLRLRRHAVGIESLTPRELAEFGPRVRDTCAAVRRVTESVRTYLMAFGEAHPHFHVLVVPRLATTPPNRWAGESLKMRAERADRDASLSLVPRLRAAYKDLSGSVTGRPVAGRS